MPEGEGINIPNPNSAHETGLMIDSPFTRQSIIPRKILSTGDQVRVTRTSGQIEDDWSIAEFHTTEGYVLVGKSQLKKKISFCDLAALNLVDEEVLKKHPEIQLQRRSFNIGDSIKLQRSSGNVDDGWVIMNFDKNTGTARTQKIDPDRGVLYRNVPVDELIRYNAVQIDHVSTSESVAQTGRGDVIKARDPVLPGVEAIRNRLKAMAAKDSDSSPTPYMDLDYAALTREQYAEQAERLQEIYDKYYPPGTEHAGRITARNGYLFFPAINGRKIDERDYRDVVTDVVRPIYFQFPDKYASEMRRAVDTLSQEYKIHLMPHREYTPFILQQVFEAMTTDPQLAEAISQIKVIVDDKKMREEVLPSVVIYTQLGKTNAQVALNKLFAYIGKYEKLGMNLTPRYNQQINRLMFYAQSGGDWKKEYINAVETMGRSVATDGIFDTDLIHFAGNHKLKLPA